MLFWKSTESKLLNTGLDLAMEWGEYFLQPIQSRLAARYPDLSSDELDRLDSTCREAMRYAHSLVGSMADPASGSIDESAWRKQVLEKYPWVNGANLGRLFSQGMYYAMK